MSNYILPEIVSCGFFNCGDEFGNLKRSPKRISKCIEIELFLENALSTFINGKEYKILKDRIIVAKEGQERHSLLPFKTVYLKISAEGELQNILCNLPDYFPAFHAEKIKELISDISLLNDEKQKNQFLIYEKMLSLIDILIKDAAIDALDGKGSFTLMHKAKKIIEDRFTEKLTTEDIASEINLSESRFRVLFGKAYGISPRQYLTNVRIANAKQIMWENIPLTLVAEKCGFGCQQYFSKIFKNETGMTPSEYKRELAKRYYCLK